MIDKKNRLFQILFLFIFLFLGQICFSEDASTCTETDYTSCGDYSGTCTPGSWGSWNTSTHCQTRTGTDSRECDNWGSYCAGDPEQEYSYNDSYIDTKNCTPTLSQQCDSAPPTCTTIITPSYWTNTDVMASMGTCNDVGSIQSGCSVSTTEILTVHDMTTSVEVVDNSGRTASCSDSPNKTKIDKKLPFSTGAGTKMINEGYPTGEIKQTLSDTSEVSFAAFKYFRIFTDIMDIAEGDSGRSGFVNSFDSWISIKGPEGETMGPIYSLTGIDLEDKGPTMPAEIVITDYFKKAGHYSISFQIYDRARNPADAVTDLLVHIVPGNVNNIESSALDILGYQKNGQSFIGSANCNDLTADNVEACGFQILLKDEFGNIIGKEGPLLNPPDLPACIFGFTPVAISPPDDLATTSVNEGKITLNWNCTETNSITYVCDGEIGTSGLGVLTPPSSGSRSYEFKTPEVSIPEMIECKFTANGGGGTSFFTGSFELVPECIHNNSMFPICFWATITQ